MFYFDKTFNLLGILPSIAKLPVGIKNSVNFRLKEYLKFELFEQIRQWCR